MQGNYLQEVATILGLELADPANIVMRFEQATVRGNDTHHAEALLSDKAFSYNKYENKAYQKLYSDEQKQAADKVLQTAADIVQPYIIW